MIAVPKNGEVLTYDNNQIIKVMCKSNGIIWSIGDHFKITSVRHQRVYHTIQKFDMVVDGETILAISGFGVSIDKIEHYGPKDDIGIIDEFKWDDNNVKEFFDRFKDIERFSTDQLIDLYKQSKLKK